LPLMANSDEMRARHYIMRLTADMKEKAFSGEVVVFLEDVRTLKEEWRLVRPELAPTESQRGGQGLQCVLDCCQLDFSAVEELDCPAEPYYENSPLKADREAAAAVLGAPAKQSLPYKVTAWSVEIDIQNEDENRFAKVLRLRYRTRGQGSIHFRRDGDGQTCAYTPASPVNNRALFPCQEPPTAMATYQVEIVLADEEWQVFCTGDEEGVMARTGTGREVSWYFYTRMVLPLSTFAVSIGRWRVVTVVSREDAAKERPERSQRLGRCHGQHEDYPCHVDAGDRGPLLPCRLAFPSGLAVGEHIQQYIRAAMRASRDVMGPHPFPRLDIVVLPRCFSGLGLASPHLIFLSPSVAAGDLGMAVRIAHEISHSWFGLVVGALDWTEEWLSEVRTGK